MSVTNNNKNLQSFLEEFYRDTSTKILEKTHSVPIIEKKYFESESDEEEEENTPVYLYTGEKVHVPTDLHILDFPMELLIKIFTYLNPGDLRSVALVCDQFYEATKYFRLIEQRTLLLHKINFTEDESPILELKESNRVFTDITLYVVRFTDNNFFWMDFGRFVKRLTLKMCIVKKDKFLSIIRYLPYLEELTLYDCNELLNRWPEEDSDKYKPRLPRLKRLNLQKVIIIKPFVFDYLMDMAPNLETLEITECFKECADSVLRVKMVDHCILSLVRKKHKIKSLFMYGTPVDDLALTKLVNIDGLSLERFSLTFNGRISNPGMLDFLKLHQNMTVLDLSDSLNLLDYCLVIICQKMTQLRELRLKRCVMISDFGLKELAGLNKLMILDLTGCERITDKGIQKGLIGDSWTNWKENMRELYIGSNNGYSEFTLGMITGRFSHITRLDVSSSTNCMTDYSMQLICKHLVLLRYLNLECCGQISDCGITGENFNDPRWHTLYPISIARLKGLQALKLSGVYQITDASLRKFRFLELRELTLARCQMITEEGILSVAIHCPSLENLDLTECQNINDYCMEAITNYLKRLKKLRVICCNQLTDLSIDSILENCKELKTLHIRGCFQITYDALQKLYSLPWLKYFHSN